MSSTMGIYMEVKIITLCLAAFLFGCNGSEGQSSSQLSNNKDETNYFVDSCYDTTVKMDTHCASHVWTVKGAAVYDDQYIKTQRDKITTAYIASTHLGQIFGRNWTAGLFIIKSNGQKIGVRVDSVSSLSPPGGRNSFHYTQVKATMKTGNLTFRILSDPLSPLTHFGEWFGMTRKAFSDEKLQSIKEQVTILLHFQLTSAYVTTSDTMGKECHQMRLDTVKVEGMGAGAAGTMFAPYTYTDDD